MPSAGQQISATIRLVRPLGEGGMGTVWVAHHLARNCEVAVKLISVEGAAADLLQARERFTREAEMAMRLRGPHVIQTFEHGLTQDGQPYLVMELLQGQSLEERIDERGPLSLEDVARLVDQTAAALADAHAIGVIHRDIKPDNIFIEAGRPTLYVKVLDFGIAKDTAPTSGGQLTAAGLMVGSPFFMAPEQMESARDVSATADIFSLGSVAYYALTGKLPFDGDTPVELWNAKKTQDMVKPSHRAKGCPPAVDAWFACALAPLPADRFSTAQQMAIAFSDAVGAVMGSAPANVRSTTAPLAPIGNVRTQGGTAPLDLDPGNQLSQPLPKTPTVPGRPVANLRAAAMTAPQQPVMAPSVTRPSIAQPPSRSAKKSSGAGKAIGIALGGVVLLGGVGAGIYFATADPPPILAQCKETQPRDCLRAANELIDDDKDDEAFRYLAVAVLRDGRLQKARDMLDDMGVPKFGESELSRLDEACDEGKTLACYLHARMSDEDHEDHAVTYLRERCEDDKDIGACAELGDVYDKGRWGVKPSPKEGVAYHRAACDGGSARGCVRLGKLTLHGLGGVKKNEEDGVEHFQKACKKKDMHGCVELGRAHARGLGGLERDLDKAADLYEKACKKKELEGCWELGIAHARARGRERDAKRAVGLFEKACVGGVMEACTEWGRQHERGQGGLTRDVARALELYQQACDNKDPSGCVELGIALELAKGTLGKDETKAVSLYKQACEADYLAGCRELATAHANGKGELERDLFAAFDLYRRACDGGDLSACVSVGFYYSRGIGGAAKDNAKAREIYEKACEDGALTACSNLGAMYDHGEGGLPKDANKAVELFEKACDDGFGNLPACANLGVMHANGRGGLKKDVGRAAEIYQKACDKGGRMACTNLGGLYNSGVPPIKRDRARATRIYEGACKQNYPPACARLGLAYERGWGVKTDDKRAVKLYQRACDAGSPAGCANLAYMYERGKGGLPRDRNRARELFRRGCDGGNAWACKQAKRFP